MGSNDPVPGEDAGKQHKLGVFPTSGECLTSRPEKTEALFASVC